MNIDTFLDENKWNIVYSDQIPKREAEFLSPEGMGLCDSSLTFLSKCYPRGIYKHQKFAIFYFLSGKNVCLTTGTASGKSLVFYVAGIEVLKRNPSAKILAIYPLKALGFEQEDRWRKAFNEADTHIQVGRIDGQTPISARVEILRNSQVLIVTPDIVHAWLFSNLSNRDVLDFLKKLSLVVVDEVHAYTGVFGSNSAFLFRRLRHILNLLGQRTSFLCASATIAEPKAHLKKLIGLDFALIDSRDDTSPRYKLCIDLVKPPLTADWLSEISGLLKAIAKDEHARFIAFVDSRKQVELISSIASREREKSEVGEALDWSHLQTLNILPYRAGFELQDRLEIQQRLTQGSLSGVVSTSALELGIDIPHINFGLLVGVPYSSTSFHQRVGRIGRHSEGRILIISRGSLYDEKLFRNPQQLLKLPPVEGALYLENARIQYIHALCIARHGGEHDAVIGAENLSQEDEFTSQIEWPTGFLELCKKERLGEIPVDLQQMKSEAGDDPNHTFPLRDVEVQFKVEFNREPEKRNLGSLSYGQLMREAYPGALYYYTTQAYRVTRVILSTRLVQVRNEKKYTTTPTKLPTLVFPNLTPGNIYSGRVFGGLICIECNLQIREAISGFKEKRGPHELSYSYPMNFSETGISFEQQRFTRNYFTTGVILTHTVFNKNRVQADVIAGVLFEAFLMNIPFERRDISFGVDKHRAPREAISIAKDTKFVSIYDQTYGSLRLTNKLLGPHVLKIAFEEALEVCSLDASVSANAETIQALEELIEELKKPVNELGIISGEEIGIISEDWVRILLPKSKGLAIRNNNKEFLVEDIFYDPKTQKLSYRGRYVDTTGANETTKIIIPVDGIVGVPGDSLVGRYNLHTGEKEILNP